MDLVALQKQMAEAQDASLGLRDMDAFLANDYFKLKKAKMDIGKGDKRIIDMELVFPFNPLEPSDTSFSEKRKYHSPLSPTTTVQLIKQVGNIYPAVKDFWNAITNNKIDWENELSEVNEDEARVFLAYRIAHHSHQYCYKATFAGFGQFGRKFLANVKFDPKSKEVTTKDTPYMIRELEQALAFRDIAIIKTEMTAKGKTEKDIKEAVSERMKKVLISNPYKVGMLRGIHFETNADMEIVLKKVESFDKYGFYMSGGKENVGKLTGVIGSKVDKHFDYIELDYYFKEPVGLKNESERNSQAWQQKTESFNSVSPIIEQIDEFNKKYREYRDNKDFFTDEVILRSVFEYKPVDDSVITAIYKDDLTEDKKKLIDAEIASTFKDLLESVDESMSDLVINAIVDEKHLVVATDVKFTDVTEENTGHGIEELTADGNEELLDYLNRDTKGESDK